MTIRRSKPDDFRIEDPDNIHTTIEVYFGNAALDGGIAPVPKIVARFCRHLASNGEQLNDRQIGLLLMVLILRDSQDFSLRMENLPLFSSPLTLERDKVRLRELGLVFTERLYYGQRNGRPPVMRAQRWDMRSLFYNLGQLWTYWLARRQEAVAEWETAGRHGPKPIYNFPADYQHEIALPPDVAADILRDVFYPVPEKWLRRAKTLAKAEPTLLKTSGRGAPTLLKRSGRQAPTLPKTSGHLVVVVDVDGADEGGNGRRLAYDFPAETVFAHFAARKGKPYEPSDKDRAALSALKTDGYSLDEIIAGMDAAFELPNKPQRFTHCARVTRNKKPANPPPASADHQPPDNRQPDNRPPDAGQPEHRQPTPAAVEPEIPRELAPAVALYAEISRKPSDAQAVAQLKIMAEECNQAARENESTGAEWLEVALKRSLRADDPIAYTYAILRNWMAHGRDADLRPTREGYRPPRKGAPKQSTQQRQQQLDDSASVEVINGVPMTREQADEFYADIRKKREARQTLKPVAP